jgi:hypothetical protein
MNDPDWRHIALLALILAVVLWAALEIMRCRLMILGAVARGDRQLAELEWRLRTQSDRTEEATMQ